MSHGQNIPDLCRARLLLHRQRSRDEAREISEAIERSVVPLSNGDAERPFMVPRGHNAYDIWYCIIDKVTSPHDILALWNVCSMFQEILTRGNRYVQVRLPHIVQLICNARPLYLKEEEIDSDSPSKITLLNLRLISKLCKTSLEVSIQCEEPTKLYLKLESADKVQGIIDDILGKMIMPATFFPPNIEVDESGGWHRNVERARFHEAVRIGLELFGKCITTFRYSSMGRPGHTYENLMEWVLYMPNLESLELFVEHGAYLRSAMPKLDDLPMFPFCAKLRALIQIQEKLPETYIQRIIVANPQIRKLAHPRYGLDGELMDPSEMNLRLENLECLHTPLYPSLLRFLQFRLPLKRIILHHNIDASITSQELFTFLNKFRNSLEHLELWFLVNAATGDTSFLDLPNLKYFKGRYWRHNTNFWNMRFIFRSSRLEVVHILVWQIITDTRAFVDGFLQRVNQEFHGLDIWQVFPKMKKVVAQLMRGNPLIEIRGQ